MSGRRRVKTIAYDADDYWDGYTDDFEEEEEEADEDQDENGCTSSSYQRRRGNAVKTTTGKKQSAATAGRGAGHVDASATGPSRALPGKKGAADPPKKQESVSSTATTSPTSTVFSSAGPKSVASQPATTQRKTPGSSLQGKATSPPGEGKPALRREREENIKREPADVVDSSSGQGGGAQLENSFLRVTAARNSQTRLSAVQAGGRDSPSMVSPVAGSGTGSLMTSCSSNPRDGAGVEKCQAGGFPAERNFARGEMPTDGDYKHETPSQSSAARSARESNKTSPATDGGGRGTDDTAPQEDRSPFSIVVIGHVDAGKSTLTGQLLFRTGAVTEREVEKMKRMSASAGKGSFFYAWLCDEGEDERERGVTIDVSYRVIVTAKAHRRISFLDAPGHQELVNNMLGGAVLADAALLVVDAGKFEVGFEGQTKEHLLIARSLNIQHFIVAVNKMDAVDWSEKAYNDVVERLQSFLTGPEIACPATQVYFVPVSALVGVNLVREETSELSRLRKGLVRKQSSSGAGAQRKRESLWNTEQLETQTKILRSWWKGPSLSDLLENIQINTLASQRQLTNEPFTACVADMWSSSSSSEDLNFSFKVTSGALRVGDKVAALPANVGLVCKALSSYGVATKSCASGDFVEKGVFCVEASAPAIDKDIPSAGIEAVGVGAVLCSSTRLLRVVSTFLCKIIVFSRELPLMPGRQLVAYIHTMTCECVVRRVLATIDRKTGEVVEQKHARRCALVFGMAGVVEVDISPGKVCVRKREEPQKQTSVLSRIILRDATGTAAAGVVVDDVRVSDSGL